MKTPLISLETRARHCCCTKYPWITLKQSQDLYVFTEASLEHAHDRLMDLVCADFLDKFSIAISPDRSRLSYRLKLEQLQAGENYLVIPDASYGLVHVFRDTLLSIPGGEQVA